MSDQWLQLGFFAFLSMQKHAMLISKKAADFINSGHVPVIVGDCPLYDQQKNSVSGSFPMTSVNQRWCASGASSTFRWHPNKVGGSCWLDLAGSRCSPWQQSSPLVFLHLSDSHVKRTRYLYQLNLAWLHVLKVQAYSDYCHQVPSKLFLAACLVCLILGALLQSRKPLWLC